MVDRAWQLYEEFLAMMQGQGRVEPDEDRLEDASPLPGSPDSRPAEVCAARLVGVLRTPRSWPLPTKGNRTNTTRPSDWWAGRPS